jgi:serine phosphatase RsbU (regulator of sigma subunit)
VLLWTDGVTERRGVDEQFGEERLEKMLAAADLGESSQRTGGRVADAVRSFAPTPLQDDMAIVVRVTTATPAAASEVVA